MFLVVRNQLLYVVPVYCCVANASYVWRYITSAVQKNMKLKHKLLATWIQISMLMCSAEMWSRSCDLAVTSRQQMRHCSWNWHHCGMSLWSRLRMLPNMLLCRLHWWCRHLTTSCRFCTLFAVITITVVILKSRYWWWTVKCWPNGCSMPFMGVIQAERINLVGAFFGVIALTSPPMLWCCWVTRHLSCNNCFSDHQRFRYIGSGPACDSRK